MIHRKRRVLRLEAGDSADGHLFSCGFGYEHMLESRRAFFELRPQGEHYVILVQWFVDGRNQTLSERVLQRRLDLPRRNIEPRCGLPIDYQCRLEAAVLKVARDIAQFG